MQNEKGFTLIELLVVVAIIGILVAIAIPQFASYRIQANNSAAKSQLRAMALANEAYFVQYVAYSNNLANLASYGYKATSNVVVSNPAAGGSGSLASSYSATAYHAQGDTTYTYDSAAGGLQ